MLSKVAVQEILVKYFKDTWRLLAILKTNKRVYKVIFFNMKKNVDSESVFTIHWDKTQILKKFRSDKINYKKMPSFLLKASAHHSFTFNVRFFYELKLKVCFPKTVCGIFHFRFCCIFIKVYIFVQQNAWTLLL